MIDAIRRALSGLLPLSIEEASFTDPTLTLAGPGWALTSVSPWRVTRDGVLLYGWSDRGALRRVVEMGGRSILSVMAPSSLMRGDPAFELSGGDWLETFSDHAVDPWVLRLPSMTFVGSPSDPTWVQ